MSQVKFTVRLLDVTSHAADGSQIPRRSVEAYLTSPDYQVIIQNKIALGGLTHKDRKLTPDLKGIVGIDDRPLIDKNTLFYITAMYFRPGDNFLYADAETFDPELFAGELKENIQNFIGYLASGTRFNCSVVIQGLWSRTGVCEKIIRIKSFDITQNPSFKGAGTVDVQLFSETVNDDSLKLSEDEQKQFSDSIESGDLTLQTRVYSSTGDVIILEDESQTQRSFSDSVSKIESLFDTKDTITYSDIVGKFGQGSKEASIFRPLQGRQLTKYDLNSLRSDNPERQPDPDNKWWMNKIQAAVDDGDRENLQSLTRQNRTKLPNIIRSVPEWDPNRDQMTDHKYDEYFRTTPKEDRQFTLIPSITTRILTEDQPRYIKFERVIKAYQLYQVQNKLNDQKLLELESLFIQDMNYLVKAVLPEIVKGRDFNSLYGLNRFDKTIGTAGFNLSRTYRKLILAERVMKFIPKGVYNDWKRDITKFYDTLFHYVFNDKFKQNVDLIEIQ